jgi:Zn-finger protein
MDGYTRAVSGQRLGKTQEGNKLKSCVFYMVHAREKVSLVISVLESVKRGLERMKLKNLHC